jgi:glycerol-3-phosphate acyltransferase PlsY
MPRLILILAASYLLGSIPFGYVLVHIFRGEDVRQSGSGNIGATNVSRKSPALGALTLLLDAAKGFFAVHLAATFSPQHDPALHRIMAAAALFSILGHMFPIWLGFRGGKGVATALGAFLRFSPMAVLFAVIIFVAVVLLSRRISLGSIVTAAAFPLAVCFLTRPTDSRVIALISAASLLIIARHHQNIRRLITGDEPRFSFGHKNPGHKNMGNQ